MIKKPGSNKARLKRHARVRKNISGTSERPRLCVYRSAKHIYAQIIDDVAGNTLLSASTMEGELKGNYGGNKDAARLVGQMIAKKAKEKGITNVVFDRGGYIYHGRVAELATAAREEGLQF